MTAGMVSGPSIVPLKLPGSGKKWMIDSDTPIELHSETPKTLLFYTTDGTKPDPFQKLGPKSTYKFTEPFFLGPGKHTIKALAVLRDGSKESPVVTKTFQVQEPLPETNEKSIKEEEGLSGGKDEAEGNEAWPMKSKTSFIEALMQNDETMTKKKMQGPVCKALDSTVFNGESDRLKSVNGYLIASQYLEQSSSAWGANDYSSGSMPRAKVTQNGASMSKCLECGTLSPVNLLAKFCTACGSSLPRVPVGHTPPVDPGTMGLCLNCQSSVPLNLPKCIICESPLHPESKLLSHGTSEKLLCLRCGTLNPFGTRKCIVCDATISDRANSVIKSSPPFPEEKKYLTCSKCGRVNSGNARFCDWCGSKPQQPTNVTICSYCKTTNLVYSNFCSSCGRDVEPPSRPEYEYIRRDGSSYRMAPRGGVTRYNSEKVRWLDEESPPSFAKPLTKSVSTQTTGLFYPSSAAIEKDMKTQMDLLNIAEASRDKRVPLTSISPGKGYWRQQLDHIFHHIKVYTQNNIDFKSSIGNLRIGKLFAALAQEELDGRELMLTFSFSLKGDDRHSLKATARTVQSAMSAISALNESVSSKADSIKSAGSTKRKKKKKKTELGKTVKKVSEESKMLLRKLSKPSSGDISHFVEELVRDGANPNHQDPEGATPLKLAIKNGWVECVSLLIDLGSDVNLQSGPKNNSPLHEAALLGLDGVDSLQMVLDHGADTDLKNSNGLTPYDMAVRSGLDPVISKFASKIGKDVLSEFGK